MPRNTVFQLGCLAIAVIGLSVVSAAQPPGAAVVVPTRTVVATSLARTPTRPPLTATPIPAASPTPVPVTPPTVIAIASPTPMLSTEQFDPPELRAVWVDAF